MIALSPRLQFLLDQARPQEALWDLCCDHGLLGLRALQSGLFPEVHFVDQVPEIMARLRQRLDQYGTGQEPAFLHTRAAEELPGILSGTVIIAGVGGEKILSILTALVRRERLFARRLVLSPHKDEELFEKAFVAHFGERWKLQTPTVLQEGRRQRPVWIAEAR